MIYTQQTTVIVFIGFLFGNSTNLNRTFIRTSVYLIDKIKHIFIYWDFQQNQCLNIKKACVHKIHKITSWGPCAHGAPGQLPSVPMIFINLMLLKVEDKYPADNSYFFIGFLFGNSTNQNRTFIHTSVNCIVDTKI
jgi:hypothetical protein